MGICDKCCGKGYIEVVGGVKDCVCLLRERLVKFLPSDFVGFGFDVEGFDYASFCCDLYVSGSVESFGRFVNTFLSYYYFSGGRDYELVTASRFVQEFYEGSYMYHDCGVLFLMFSYGYRNKLSTDYLCSLLRERRLGGRDTVVFVDDRDFTDSRFIDLYGMELMKLLRGFKKVK